MSKQKTIEPEVIDASKGPIGQIVRMDPPTPMDMLAMMVEKDADPDKLGKMMDLAERWANKEAEKKFSAAMNACQAEMPTVVKDKRNNETNQRYAPIETVQTYAKPVYIKHGFSLSFGTEIGSEPGLTHCYVDVQHVGGHTKRFYLHNVPLDDKGPKGGAVKTQVQGLMSSMSYAQGRLVRLAFNITVADEDRDGQLGHLNEEQIETINRRLEECSEAGNPVKYEDFLAWLKADNLNDVPASRYGTIIAYLDTRKKVKPK